MPDTRERNRADDQQDDSKNGKAESADENKNDEKERPQTPEEKRRAKIKKWIIIASIVVLLIIAAIVGIPWYLHARHFEKTDDAFIDAHSAMIAPQVEGRVLRVLVEDNQRVDAGTVLLEIDPADFKARVAQSEASLAESQAKVLQAKAQKQVAQANVAQAQADVEQAQVNLQNAQTELKRYESLSPESTSKQRLDDLRTAARNAEAQLTAQQKKLVAAQAQVTLADSQITAANSSVDAAQAQLDEAQLKLSYTTVRALIAGRVARRDVQAGNYVQPGQQVMILVPREIWVTANFKETQLTDMRVGQPVTITVDAYPDEEFRGRIDSIQPSSAAEYSLLPPENATGNYVKVVQRVPVKIVFDQPSGEAYERLSPGMSVTPSVRVR